MLRRKTYLYYIFLDDDIVLFGIKETTLNLWMKLEDSLRKTEPAVAALLVWGDKKSVYIGFIKQNKSAFHYQSVNCILPYSSRFDAIS